MHGRDIVQFEKPKVAWNKGAINVPPLFKPPSVLSLVIMQRFHIRKGSRENKHVENALYPSERY